MEILTSLRKMFWKGIDSLTNQDYLTEKQSGWMILISNGRILTDPNHIKLNYAPLYVRSGNICQYKNSDIYNLLRKFSLI